MRFLFLAEYVCYTIDMSAADDQVRSLVKNILVQLRYTTSKSSKIRPKTSLHVVDDTQTRIPTFHSPFVWVFGLVLHINDCRYSTDRRQLKI